MRCGLVLAGVMLAVCAGCGGGRGGRAVPATAAPLPSNHVSEADAPPDAGVDAAAVSVQDGERLYRTRGCKQCHTVDGSAGVGPTWKGLFGSRQPLTDGRTVRVEEAYLRRSMVEPQVDVCQGFNAVMPSFKGQLTDPQIEDLIGFIASLR